MCDDAPLAHDPTTCLACLRVAAFQTHLATARAEALAEPPLPCFSFRHLRHQLACEHYDRYAEWPTGEAWMYAPWVREYLRVMYPAPVRPVALRAEVA